MCVCHDIQGYPLCTKHREKSLLTGNKRSWTASRIPWGWTKPSGLDHFLPGLESPTCEFVKDSLVPQNPVIYHVPFKIAIY